MCRDTATVDKSLGRTLGEDGHTCEGAMTEVSKAILNAFECDYSCHVFAQKKDSSRRRASCMISFVPEAILDADEDV